MATRPTIMTCPQCNQEVETYRSGHTDRMDHHMLPCGSGHAVGYFQCPGSFQPVKRSDLVVHTTRLRDKELT